MAGTSPLTASAPAATWPAFEIVNDNKLNMTSAVTGRNSYTANVTATGDDVFGNDNTWRTIEVTLDLTSFATTWRTDSANQTITVPVTGSNLTISWGDGTTSAGVSGAQTHTYAAAGNHTVAVTGGLEAFTLNNHANATKLVSIDQWSNASWTTMKDAFRGANNMVYNAADSPDLSGVTDMNSMFPEFLHQRRHLGMGRLGSHRHVQHVQRRLRLQRQRLRLGRLGSHRHVPHVLPAPLSSTATSPDGTSQPSRT